MSAATWAADDRAAEEILGELAAEAGVSVAAFLSALVSTYGDRAVRDLRRRATPGILVGVESKETP